MRRLRNIGQRTEHCTMCRAGNKSQQSLTVPPIFYYHPHKKFKRKQIKIPGFKIFPLLNYESKSKRNLCDLIFVRKCGLLSWLVCAQHVLIWKNLFAFLPITKARAKYTVPTENVTYRKLIVFELISQKLPIPIPIGNCFGINKVTVTDTDPQSYRYRYRSEIVLELIRLPLPISIPIRSHLPPLLAYSVSLLEFPKGFVHNALNYWNFSGILCIRHLKCCSRCRKGP